MKTTLSIIICLISISAFGQSRVFNASNYATWSSQVYSGNASTGSSSIVVNPVTVFTSTGLQFIPFQPNEVITIDFGQSTAETVAVTPSNCFIASLNCTLTGNFTFKHIAGAGVTSGTFGLQDAIGQALLAPAAGTVLIDSTWTGPAGSAIITSAVGSTSVTVQDNRSGTPQSYQWNGFSYLPTGSTPLNLNATLMPHWTSCVARVKINAGNCRVYAVGDSTTYGDYSANTSNTGDLTVASYPTRLSQYLNASTLPAQRDSFMGAGSSQGAGFGNDARVVLGTGWSTVNSASTGGLLFTASSATTAFSFTPVDQVNQFILWYVTNGGGTGSYQVDSGSVTDFSSGGAAGLHSVTISAGTLGNHTLNLQWVSGGAVFVLGVEASNTAIGSVQIINAGIPGSGAGTVTGISWAQTTSAWSPLFSVPIQAPDVVLLDLGINNWTGANATSVAVYTTNMQAIITAYLATSDVILITPAPSSIANVSLATQAQYVAAMYQLAAKNNIPLIDNFNRWGSYERTNVAPFLFYNNVLHPGPNGYSDFAQAIAVQLLSVVGH
jgi:lysophospholipase L1-like esterase